MASTGSIYSSCSIQVKLPNSYIQLIQAWTSAQIPANLLYQDATGKYGIDPRPHLTISQGFRSDQCVGLLEKAKEFNNTTLELGNIGCFKNKEKFVLWADVHRSNRLMDFRQALLPYHTPKKGQDPNRWNSHVTLAYLLPVAGAEWFDTLTPSDKLEFAGLKWTATEIEFVDDEGTFWVLKSS